MANPIFIPIAFAKNGIKNVIEKVLQVGQAPESLTWDKGAPLITMTPIDDGGKAPLGQDFNGALNAMCEHNVHVQNGNRYLWSQDVIDNYGGYSLGSIVQSDDTLREFRSLADANTTNPNNGLGTTWEIYSGQGSIPVATSTTAGITRVLNTLTSSDTGAALSAAQGSVLNGRTQQADIGNVGIARFASLTEVQNRSTLPIAIRPNDAGIIVDAKAIGVDQNWIDVTSSRALNTNYVNTTGKPIMVSVIQGAFNNNAFLDMSVNGVLVFSLNNSDGFVQKKTASIIIPVGATYRLNGNGSYTWSELR